MTLEERVAFSSRMIHNIQTNPPLSELISRRGYGEPQITEAGNYLANSRTAIEIQAKEYSEKFAVSSELDELRENLELEADDLFTVSRIALKDNDEAYSHLKLKKKFRRGKYNWHEDASSFVNRLISREDAMVGVGGYGFTTEEVVGIKDGLDSIDKLQAIRLKEAGEAEEATRIRDEKMDILDGWVVDFLEIAPIALRSHPQWLEQLGIVTP